MDFSLPGHSKEAKEKAQTILANFRQFIEEHKDEIEALRSSTAVRIGRVCVMGR